jgi:formylglycine-generating enzyme required for sulfatase activity
MGAGAGEQGFADELPRHGVTLRRGYWLGTTPVTREQYQALMGASPSGHKGGPGCPVDRVSFVDCVRCCEQLAGMLGRPVRLPTEAEWEYACRAGTATAYSSGADPVSLDRHAWCATSAGGRPHAVGQKKPNTWGLYDMHGNVREWCLDYHGRYPEEEVCDPRGPSCGVSRVLRGGSWSLSELLCRSACRGAEVPDSRSEGNGFRLVLPEVELGHAAW